MNVKQFVTLLLIFSSGFYQIGFCQLQKDIDSTKALIQTMEDTDSAKVLRMVYLSNMMMSIQLSEALVIIEEANLLAQRQNFKRGIIATTTIKANIKKETGDLNNADSLFDVALKLAIQIKDEKAKANIRRDWAQLKLREGNDLEAFNLAQLAKAHYESTNDTSKLIQVISTISKISRRSGNYEVALAENFKCLDLSRKIGKISFEAFFLSDIGLVAKESGDTTKAIEYYEQALDLYTKARHKSKILSNSIALTGLFINTNRDKRTSELSTRCITLAKELENKYFLAHSYHNYANFLVKMKEYNEAYENFGLALSLFKELGIKDEMNMVQLSHGRGIYKYLMDKKHKSLEIIQTDDDLAKLSLSKLRNSYFYYRKQEDKLYFIATALQEITLFYRTYSQNGDSLYKYGIKLFDVKEKRLDAKKLKKLTEISLNYNFDKQQLADSLKNAQDQAQKDALLAMETSKLKQQKTISYASVAGAFLLLLLAGFIYYSRQKTKKQNLAIEKRNTQIEWLLKEIHHRVKNNLQIVSSLMSIQGRALSDDVSKNLIRESQNRIKSMSLVHESLYLAEDLSEIDIEPFIKRIAESVNTSLKSKEQNIRLDIQSENLKLNAEQAVPIGIIINELASNAYKHSFKNQDQGVLSISFIKEGQTLSLNISDNGTPFPENFKIDYGGQSIGLALVQSLAEDQLEGHFNWKTKNGSKFNITFPIKLAA